MERIEERVRVADLEELIGPPQKRPPAVNWKKLESSLGLTFPADYKELCSRYPTLEFDDFLLWVNAGMWAPRAVIRGAVEDLEFLRRRNRSDMRILDDSGRRSKRPMFPLYPEVGGLLMWGGTVNGDNCMWLTDPDPEKWTIVIENREFWHFQGSLLEFLVGVLDRRVKCPLFPSEFPTSLTVKEIESES